MLDEHQGQRAARLQQLTQTGPGTPMGTLLRQFWQPIAVANSLAAGTARAIRIMCEDLTLYRGASGTPHLIGGRCAHRCTILHTGWVEADQLRCMYHGWRYDGSGACTEMPAERQLRADVRIAGYPVHEYGGLIFTYMGADAAPEFDLPRREDFERDDYDISNHAEIWDCNWLQQSENSLDATHLSFVHQWPTPTRLGEEIGPSIPELSYEETSAGIRQTAARGENNIRISNWTFPNNNFINSAPPFKGAPWVRVSAYQVPIDDENTLRISIMAYPGGEIGEQVRKTGGTLSHNSKDYAKELFEEHRLPDIPAAAMIMSQDYAAVRGQGTIQDRTREQLGASDAGIALLRKIIFRELDTIEAGTAPKKWKRVEGPLPMPTPVGAR
jgi:5,5'-dehydrodivanillate O-demethylase